MQAASFRPSRNLLRDPVWGAPSGDAGSSVRDKSGYTRAHLQAYLNVDSIEFESDDYDDGQSTELAGRSLYGEYALFFPAQILATEGRDGFHPERIEDILSRFDYVSVARIW